jgi:hypothetical protein
MWESRGPGIVDDIRDEIRAWFFEWFEKMGFFDYIPPAEVGGSYLIATGQVRTPEEYFNSLKEKPVVVAPTQDDATTESPVEVLGWKMEESRAIFNLKEVNEDFLIKWSPHVKEILDPSSSLIESFIYEDICYKLHLEMREIADEFMRVELETLNEALILDRGSDNFALPKRQEFQRKS